jgi:hypothetical protein
MLLLIPFTGISFKTLTGGIILGGFMGILNNINTKLKRKDENETTEEDQEKV